MSPYEQARAVYGHERCARTFEQDRDLHFEHGFVFSTPTYFAMGRAVPRKGDPALIVDPGVRYHLEACDCWHIYLFAGDITKLPDLMPWALPWISIERKNELRFYPLAEMRRLLNMFDERPTHSVLVAQARA